MPIFMDRHDVSDQVTAENVAELHQKDLKIQHQYNCRGLTYWFDDKRKTAFCLIEAPNIEKLKEMHFHAHGDVPNQIIEVSPEIVESFLGRIEDPEKATNTKLNIINEPAFRVIMVIKFLKFYITKPEIFQFNDYLRSVSKSIQEICDDYRGRLVWQKSNKILSSYPCVTDAVKAAKEFWKEYAVFCAKSDKEIGDFSIGLSAGVPINGDGALFEKAVKTSSSFCFNRKPGIYITQEVKQLYESENMGKFFDDHYFHVFSSDEASFLCKLLDFIEERWNRPGFGAKNFSKMGFSQSKFYRMITSALGKTPQEFVGDFRLDKSLDFFTEKEQNISHISYESGFSSPSYYTKCFKKKFGIQPSGYFKSQE